jgi:hypothetical protein
VSANILSFDRINRDASLDWWMNQNTRLERVYTAIAALHRRGDSEARARCVGLLDAMEEIANGDDGALELRRAARHLERGVQHLERQYAERKASRRAKGRRHSAA